MIRRLWKGGVPVLPLSFLVFLPVSAGADVLAGTTLEDDIEIARLDVPEGTGWCVLPRV